jgi:hypothetical protein
MNPYTNIGTGKDILLNGVPIRFAIGINSATEVQAKVSARKHKIATDYTETRFLFCFAKFICHRFTV